MWGGFFLVIPLITVHFVDGLGWAAASIGLVLGLRQLTQQGLTVFGGAWADRLGPKPLILAGCLIRTLGFGWMGFVSSLPELLAASVLAGIGGGLFDAPKSAAITAVTRPEHRARMFSLVSIAGNLGMVTGPLLGAWMLSLGFQRASLVAASAYLVAFVLMLVTLPHLRPAPSQQTGMGGLKTALNDRVFRNFTLVLCGYFLLSTQLNVAVTLRAVELAGPGATGPLYALSAGLAVVLQYPLLRLAERHFRVRHVLVAAVLLVGLALGLMGLTRTFAQLLACVALYSFGTMLVFPMQQTLTARLAPPSMVGSYFGFSAISLGLGGAVGNFVGGALVDAGTRLHFPLLPWLTFSLVGLLTAAGLGAVLREIPTREEMEARQTA
ncbi:MFS transporter [Deinococcus sp. VB343]|uniref:MFS transporter n=1 Tax=Deinococcus sp. VB343 TaxID=3385567 RepID=UPI0039C8D5EC